MTAGGLTALMEAMKRSRWERFSAVDKATGEDASGIGERSDSEQAELVYARLAEAGFEVVPSGSSEGQRSSNPTNEGSIMSEDLQQAVEAAVRANVDKAGGGDAAEAAGHAQASLLLAQTLNELQRTDD